MYLETLKKLLIEQKQADTVEYLLMSQEEKVAQFDFIQYCVPENLVMLVKIGSKYVRSECIEIHKMEDDNVITTVLIIHNSESVNDPETFSLDQDLPVRIFQEVNIK